MTGALPTQNLEIVRHKHRGRSLIEGIKIVALLTLAFGMVPLVTLVSVPSRMAIVSAVAGLTWLLCVAFVLFFFRDANPHPPLESGVLLSPSHGTVDYIDTTMESHFLNGPARRISIYLSLMNVHVQHAPISGRVEVLQHFPARWSRAVRRDASRRNEHLLIGLESGGGPRMALRLISGIWVRRIVPWIGCGQQIVAGERIGLIRFGSRVDVFLPPDAQVVVKPGDKVQGGVTILARFPE